MKKYFLFGLVTGVVLSAAAIYTYQAYTESEPSVAKNEIEAEETHEPNDATDENTLLFTNLYRTLGDKNRYIENPDKQLAFVINSSQELDEWWVKLFQGNSLAPPKPVVNFKDQSVLVAMLDQKNEGEHLLTLQSIQQEGSTLKLTAQEKGPGTGCPSSKQPSRSLHIVLVKKTSASEVQLKTEKTQAAPCQILLEP